jgi:hypothetical protein
MANEPSKPFLKWLASAAGQGVVGWGIIKLGGYLVGLIVTYFFAVLAYDSGLSWYWLILLSGALLFFFVNVVNRALLIVEWFRQRKAKATQEDAATSEQPTETVGSVNAADVVRLESLIKELEAEKAALEKGITKTGEQHGIEIGRLQDSAQTRSVRASMNQNLLDRYKWLHEMVEGQARDIGRYVVVERVRFCYHKFDAPIPYLIFAVDVRNKSVFDITIEDEMKGHITIAGERLLGEKELIYNPKISPSGTDSLTIKQRLNPTEVNLVAACEKEPLGAFYYFEKLEILIAARTEFPSFDRAPLTLPQHISSKDDEVARLKDELASLHRRSEAIIKLKFALGGAYTLANLFEAGEPPSRERIEHWFNSTLRGHIRPDDLEALCDGLPELTDSPTEQKELIDMYCSRLRGLIREQRQKQ